MHVIAERRTRDWLHTRAGDGFGQCGSNNARAKALAVDPSVTSRIANARPETRTVPGEFFEMLWGLAVCPRTTPYPLLAEADAVAKQGMIRGRSDADLITAFWKLYREENAKQGAEDTATGDYVSGETDDLSVVAEAHLAEAAHQAEFAAVCRELEARGIDPRGER